MKILLLGEFSGFYKNLKEGLIELGHDTLIASHGDDWKNIPRDIDLGAGSGFYAKLKRKIMPLWKINQLSGFDVVQYINPFYFYHKALPNKFIFSQFIKRNGKVYMSAAGDDAYYWRKGRSILKYGPFEDSLKYDIKKKSYFMSTQSAFEFNAWIASRVSGVIPTAYDYEVSYKECKNRKETIPLPINTNKIEYKDNYPNKKIVVFHGLNRYGFKGTRHVEKAFALLSTKYPNDLELIINGGLPLKDYLDLIQRVNVVVDQTNSYSTGVNGLYAMAMGKVVLGGAEPESLISLGCTETPVINITPSAESIVKQVEFLLDNRDVIPEIGFRSRQFVERTHGHILVAQKYIEEWSK